jgi:calcium-dependent protein kinase
MGCNSSNTKKVFIIKSKNCETQSVDTLEKLTIRRSTFVFYKTTNILLDYELGPALGAGAFGSVRTAVHKQSGQERAIKTVRKDKILKDMQTKSKFFSEIEILRLLTHPNIVQLYEFYEDRKSFHLVTEKLNGGELFEFIVSSQHISESIAAHFMNQVLRAINYCHLRGIIHRDLKPENLLLDKRTPNSTLKIIDFGASGLFNGSENLKARLGTSYYIAPEVLRKNYNEKCDIWSCGVILYILLSGRPPFGGRNDEEILARVKKGVFSFSGHEWENVSKEAKDLISKMLTFDMNHRISAEEALKHDFFSRSLEISSPKSLSDVVENMKGFRATEKLQHAVLTFIASHLSNKEETKILAENFKAIDKNGDGKLSKEELLEEFMKSMNQEEAIQEVNRILELVDMDQNGFIDYSEFLTANLKKESILSIKNLENAFKMFDIDGSGAITAEEIKRILGDDVASKDQVWRSIIEKADRDGDGQIDLHEFKEMMLKLIKSE